MSSPFSKEPPPSLTREKVIAYLEGVKARGFPVREAEGGIFYIDLGGDRRIGLQQASGQSVPVWGMNDGPGTRLHILMLFHLEDLRRRVEPLLGSAPPAAQLPTPSTGTTAAETLGDYRFERTNGNRLGSGGFSDVYRATHIPTGDQCAIKISRSDPDSLSRMRREIEVQRQLASPNVVPILAAPADGSWFVMPIADETLAAFFDRHTLVDDEVETFIRDVSAGLHAANDLDVVHRDLSPTNVLRLNGKWAIADWGYVRRPAGETSRRLTPSGVGTAPWAAPETWTDGHNVDRRADIYSLGRLVGWLVSRRQPIPLEESPIDFRSRWYPFVRKLTARSPDARPQWIGEVLELLSTLPKSDATDPTEQAARDVEFDMYWTVTKTHDVVILDVRYIPRYEDGATSEAMRGGIVGQHLPEFERAAALALMRAIEDQFEDPPPRVVQGRELTQSVSDFATRYMSAGFEGTLRNASAIEAVRSVQIQGGMPTGRKLVYIRIDHLAEEAQAAIETLDAYADKLATKQHLERILKL